MSDLLLRIKRSVIAGNVIFTSKAEAEMEADGLLRTEVQESIIYAPAIRKTIRSTRGSKHAIGKRCG